MKEFEIYIDKIYTYTTTDEQEARKVIGGPGNNYIIMVEKGVRTKLQ